MLDSQLDTVFCLNFLFSFLRDLFVGCRNIFCDWSHFDCGQVEGLEKSGRDGAHSCRDEEFFLAQIGKIEFTSVPKQNFQDATPGCSNVRKTKNMDAKRRKGACNTIVLYIIANHQRNMFGHILLRPQFCSFSSNAYCNRPISWRLPTLSTWTCPFQRQLGGRKADLPGVVSFVLALAVAAVDPECTRRHVQECRN